MDLQPSNNLSFRNNFVENIRLHKVFRPSDKTILQDEGLYYENSQNTITECNFYIDSTKRRLLMYPSPFKFHVTFNNNVNNEDVNGPSISKELKQVSYIFIKNMNLPLKLLPKTFINKRYIILRMKELLIPNQYSTIDKFNSDTDILMKQIGRDDVFINYEASSIIRFADNNMPMITKLTFEILSPIGDNIPVYTNLDKTFENNKSCELFIKKIKYKPIVYCKIIEPDNKTFENCKKELPCDDSTLSAINLKKDLILEFNNSKGKRLCSKDKPIRRKIKSISGNNVFIDYLNCDFDLTKENLEPLCMYYQNDIICANPECTKHIGTHTLSKCPYVNPDQEFNNVFFEIKMGIKERII